MLLCDIGNTSYHFYKDGHRYKKFVEDFSPDEVKEKVYFISVNQKENEKLSKLGNWIDLQEYIDKTSYYETMGIDRIVATHALNEGVIIDAGSAITVDVVKNGKFEGGFIYPGIDAMSQTYKNISPSLDYSFNFELNLDKIPKNTQDAITYGFIKPFYEEIHSYNLDIILTGGNAKEFKKIFKDAKVDETLLFKAMKKIMKKADLC